MDIGQAIITLIVSDVEVALSNPLATFFAAEAAANGDPNKLTLNALQFEASAIAAAPQALGSLTTQLATALAARVAAKTAGAPASAAAALAALAGTAPAA